MDPPPEIIQSAGSPGKTKQYVNSDKTEVSGSVAIAGRWGGITDTSIFRCRQYLRGFVRKHHAAYSCTPHLRVSDWESKGPGTGLFTSNSRDSWFEAQSTWTWQLPITFSWPLTHSEPAFCSAFVDVFTFREPRRAEGGEQPWSQGGADVKEGCRK